MSYWDFKVLCQQYIDSIFTLVFCQRKPSSLDIELKNKIFKISFQSHSLTVLVNCDYDCFYFTCDNRKIIFPLVLFSSYSKLRNMSSEQFPYSKQHTKKRLNLVYKLYKTLSSFKKKKPFKECFDMLIINRDYVT